MKTTYFTSETDDNTLFLLKDNIKQKMLKKLHTLLVKQMITHCSWLKDNTKQKMLKNPWGN